MPVKMGNDIAERFDIDVIGLDDAKDRSLRGVEIRAEGQPFFCGQLARTRRVARVEHQLAVTAEGLVLRQVQRRDSESGDEVPVLVRFGPRRAERAPALTIVPSV